MPIIVFFLSFGNVVTHLGFESPETLPNKDGIK